MRNSTKTLRVHRETVRELNQESMRIAGGQASLTLCACSLPPTFCACTGTETYTNICCIENA